MKIFRKIFSKWEDPLIEFNIGKWTFSIFNPECFGYWAWKRSGYDCLWDEWSFGFLFQVERETEYMDQLREEYPLPTSEDLWSYSSNHMSGSSGDTNTKYRN